MNFFTAVLSSYLFRLPNNYQIKKALEESGVVGHVLTLLVGEFQF